MRSTLGNRAMKKECRTFGHDNPQDSSGSKWECKRRRNVLLLPQVLSSVWRTGVVTLNMHIYCIYIEYYSALFTYNQKGSWDQVINGQTTTLLPMWLLHPEWEPCLLNTGLVQLYARARTSRLYSRLPGLVPQLEKREIWRRKTKQEVTENGWSEHMHILVMSEPK